MIYLEEDDNDELLDDPIRLIDSEENRFILNSNARFNSVIIEDPGCIVDISSDEDVPETVNSTSSKGSTFILPVRFFDIARNIDLLRECRPLSIKLIDCDKFPKYSKVNRTLQENPNNVEQEIINNENDIILLGTKNNVEQKHALNNVLINLNNSSSLNKNPEILDERCDKNIDFKRFSGLIGIKNSETNETLNTILVRKGKGENNTKERHDLDTYTRIIDKAYTKLQQTIQSDKSNYIDARHQKTFDKVNNNSKTHKKHTSKIDNTKDTEGQYIDGFRNVNLMNKESGVADQFFDKEERKKEKINNQGCTKVTGHREIENPPFSSETIDKKNKNKFNSDNPKDENMKISNHDVYVNQNEILSNTEKNSFTDNIGTLESGSSSPLLPCSNTSNKSLNKSQLPDTDSNISNINSSKVCKRKFYSASREISHFHGCDIMNIHALTNNMKLNNNLTYFKDNNASTPNTIPNVNGNINHNNSLSMHTVVPSVSIDFLLNKKSCSNRQPISRKKPSKKPSKQISDKTKMSRRKMAVPVSELSNLYAAVQNYPNCGPNNCNLNSSNNNNYIFQKSNQLAMENFIYENNINSVQPMPHLSSPPEPPITNHINYNPPTNFQIPNIVSNRFPYNIVLKNDNRYRLPSPQTTSVRQKVQLIECYPSPPYIRNQYETGGSSQRDCNNIKNLKAKSKIVPYYRPYPYTPLPNNVYRPTLSQPLCTKNVINSGINNRNHVKTIVQCTVPNNKDNISKQFVANTRNTVIRHGKDSIISDLDSQNNLTSCKDKASKTTDKYKELRAALGRKPLDFTINALGEVIREPLNVANKNTSQETRQPNKGYSPPILPIPTYEKTFEILQRMRSENLEGQNIITWRMGLKKKDRLVEGNNNNQNNEKTARKISLKEYKNRASTRDAVDKVNKVSNLESKDLSKDIPTEDLGYDSDCTLKLELID